MGAVETDPCKFVAGSDRLEWTSCETRYANGGGGFQMRKLMPPCSRDLDRRVRPCDLSSAICGFSFMFAVGWDRQVLTR